MMNFYFCIIVFLVAALKCCQSARRPLCKTPDEPSHANIRYKKFDRNRISKDGSKIIYRCKDGFQMIGSYRIFCQKDGKWTDHPPICISKHQMPKQILNGKMKVKRRGKKLKVTYRCNEGYRMQGRANSVWSKGKWRRDPPVCIVVDFGECGESVLKPRGRILSGTSFHDGVQWPWQAAIFRNNDMICGASLIRNDVVITAATCLLGATRGSHGLKKTLLPNSYRIIVGEKNLIIGKEAADERRDWLETSGHKVKAIKYHPNYKFGEIDPNDFEDDIAIFQLEKPVKWSAKIRPICLPQKSDQLKDRQEKEQYGFVTGWGNTLNESGTFQNQASQELLHALLPVKDSKTCEEKYFVKKKMFCAGDGRGIKDACKGDSGGPFAMKLPIDETRVKYRFKLMGIASWGMSCGTYGAYGYYTRVTNYLDWIQKSLKELD